MRRLATILAIALLALLLSGCAYASAKQTTHYEDRTVVIKGRYLSVLEKKSMDVKENENGWEFSFKKTGDAMSIEAMSEMIGIGIAAGLKKAVTP